MDRRNKGILLIIIIILILIGFVAYVDLGDTAFVDLKLNGISVESEIHSINLFSNDEGMNKEISNYVLNESEKDYSTAYTIKSGVENITKKYGYDEAKVSIESEFGKDSIPLFCTVDGTSMEPTFHDGESVIVNKTHDVSVGDCVVANSPEYGRIIKRVSKINGNQVYLTSDNKEVKYTYKDGYIYKEQGVKTWVDKDNIVGIVMISNVKKEDLINNNF